MIRFLKIWFVIVLLAMLGVTLWASSEVALWKTPRAVATHPWFIATLFDTYFAFFTIYAWMFYKETKWTMRLLWFVAVVTLGNIAIAPYLLWQLWRLPEGTNLQHLLLRSSPGKTS